MNGRSFRRLCWMMALVSGSLLGTSCLPQNYFATLAGVAVDTVVLTLLSTALANAGVGG